MFPIGVKSVLQLECFIFYPPPNTYAQQTLNGDGNTIIKFKDPFSPIIIFKGLLHALTAKSVQKPIVLSLCLCFCSGDGKGHPPSLGK